MKYFGVEGLAAGGSLAMLILGGSRGGDELLEAADRSIDSDEERRGGGIGWG